jgi:hypothetical protein
MRPIYPFDLEQLSRRVMAMPKDMQKAYVADVILRAQIADRYRKRLNKSHPEYGSGTLSSAIPSQDIPSSTVPRFCDAPYLAALSVVISQLCAEKSHFP